MNTINTFASTWPTFTIEVVDTGLLPDTETLTIVVSAPPTPEVLTVGEASVSLKGKTLTVSLPITNVSADTVNNVEVTAASLDGTTQDMRLPSIKNIRPGTTKSVTLKFAVSGTASGDQTLTVEGTSSAGGFSTVQTVVVP